MILFLFNLFFPLAGPKACKMFPFVFPDTRLITVAGEIVQLSLRVDRSLDSRCLPTQREIQSLVAAIVKFGNDRDYKILGDGYVLFSTRKDWGISDKYIFSCANWPEPLVSRPYKYVFEIQLLSAPRDKEYETGDNSLTAAHHPELSAAIFSKDTPSSIETVTAKDKDATFVRTFEDQERHVDNANHHTLDGSVTSPSSVIRIKESLNNDNSPTIGSLEYTESHEKRHASDRDDDGLDLDTLGMDPPSFGSPRLYSVNITQHHALASPLKRRSELGSLGSQWGTIDEETAGEISNQAYSGGEGSETTKLAMGNEDRNETGVEDTLNRVKRPRVETTEADRFQVDDEGDLDIESVDEAREQNKIDEGKNTSGSIFGLLNPRYLLRAFLPQR
ncbi:hypothetical protein BC937DRAFT_90821 [Endogone sp. FLAS-F59071]|nr:hypothetical protein BC937DRAFT_90821 [Endogone sp. FLAS-F59071]|eukprot:RUS16774.1 hypothetical protein BC937DRAFT_90821 [Endogone sp. FLAS-F59071]